MNISTEFKAAIEAAGGGPVEVTVNDEQYVLIRAEVYRKLQAVLDDGTKFALQEMGRKSGWNDPSMDAYDALDPRKQ